VADHDQRMKAAVQQFLPEFVALAVADWAGRFDLSSPDWLPQEVFLDPPQGKRRQVDLVARAPLTQPIGENDEALLHVEIESGESLTDLRRRMPGYRAGLRMRHDLPVLSLALYLDVGLEGVGWDEAVEEIWGEPTDRTRWRYVGLPGLDAMRHAQGDNVLAAALSVLMSVAEDRKAELKATAMERIARANLTVDRRATLVEIVEAYLPLHGPHMSDYNHLLLTEKYQMARQLGETSFEKGEKKGEQKGKREAIRDLLEAWFGPLSEGARQRFEALSPDKLRELSLAMRGAKSLAELGLEDVSNGAS
jgi:hypothetical protein